MTTHDSLSSSRSVKLWLTPHYVFDIIGTEFISTTPLRPHIFDEPFHRLTIILEETMILVSSTVGVCEGWSRLPILLIPCRENTLVTLMAEPKCKSLPTGSAWTSWLPMNATSTRVHVRRDMLLTRLPAVQ
jgi:hypothetical protein